MDMNDPRPHSRGLRQAQEHGSVVHKVFNCIVDDSALIQGAKRSTRDGIPKWVAAGRIKLFVPLFALDHTARAKEGKGRAANDAAEALQWLDNATSKYPDTVTLQGGFEQFESWVEVERFAQPKTLFSEDDYSVPDQEVEEMVSQTEALGLDHSGGDTGRSFSSNDSLASQSTVPSLQSGRSASPLSPPASPTMSNADVATHRESFPNGKLSTDTPTSIRPLINYILWRVHQEGNPIEAMDSFILLSDNLVLRRYAQRYGIRSKTLTEIRYVIARESQDARNRQAIQHKDAPFTSGVGHSRNGSGQANGAKSRPSSTYITDHGDRLLAKNSSVNDEEDEDQVIFKRAPKGPAAVARSPSLGRATVNGSVAPQSPRGSLSGVRGGAGRASPRPPNRGRGGAAARRRAVPSQQSPASGPIDPDSFARPSPGRGAARGGRGLWMPT